MRTLLVLLVLQTADGEMARLEEWAKAQPDNGPGCVGIGDEYYQVAKKFPKDKQRFLDKANEWWAKGWPNLDQFWKDKTRANLLKIYAGPNVAGRPLRDWAQGQFAKADVASTCVHSGAGAMRILPQKTNIGLAEAVTLPLKLTAAKECVVSFWSLSSGTDGGETAVLHVYDAKGKEVATGVFSIPSDTPVWTKVQTTVTLPPGAERANFIYLTSSKTGTIYVDDLSVKLDGKETARDGGFEGR